MCIFQKTFSGVDKIICTPIVQCVKLCVDIINLIREFWEGFCFSSADLKTLKPLCDTLYGGPEPDALTIETKEELALTKQLYGQAPWLYKNLPQKR